MANVKAYSVTVRFTQFEMDHLNFISGEYGSLSNALRHCVRMSAVVDTAISEAQHKAAIEAAKTALIAEALEAGVDIA